MYFGQLTIYKSLKTLLPLMLMVNGLWSNHITLSEHKRNRVAR